MELEICKTENGWHVTDKDDGDWCFENSKSLLAWLKDFLPTEPESEIKVMS